MALMYIALTEQFVVLHHVCVLVYIIDYTFYHESEDYVACKDLDNYIYCWEGWRFHLLTLNLTSILFLDSPSAHMILYKGPTHV